MPAEMHQLLLMRQRAAVLRAIKRTSEDNDVALLQSVVALLEELHDIAPFAFTRKEQTTKH